MTEEQFKLLHELVIQPIRKHGGRIFIFGSRVSGSHHPHSDVDLLFKMSSETKLQMGFLSQIREAIEESRFPFTVDLVDEEDLAESYRESVFKTRIELK